MRLGLMRDEIVIERSTQTGVTSLNEPIVSWSEFVATFAEVEARRGREFFDDTTHQRFSETVYLFRCHSDAITGINTAMRIVFEGHIYDIRDIRPDYGKRECTVIEATVQPD